MTDIRLHTIYLAKSVPFDDVPKKIDGSIREDRNTLVGLKALNKA